MRDTPGQPMRLAVALLMASLAPAQAALTVCNKTAKPVKVAVGRTNGAEWTSQGWWTIAPKACAAVVPSSLNARFYYLFATDGGAGSWDGTHSFCVSSHGRFDITGRGNCLAHGFGQKGFFEVDTRTAADYTQTLSD
jgi:uncharacterized membrane protein